MSQGFIRNVDEGLLGMVLNAVVFEGPAKAAGLIGRAANFVGESVNNGLSMVGGTISNGLGSVSSAVSASGPDMSPVKTPEISAPAVAPDRFHVDMNDLGNFAAPSFGAGSIGGHGMGR